MTRRWVPWLVLGAIVVAVLVWAALPGDSPSRTERAHDLATQLRCPDCEGVSIADSQTSSAIAGRAKIRQMVDRGRSDEQIRRYFVDLYGESILLSPEGSGLGVLVWGLPAAALVLGAAGLVVALRRWQRQPRMHATGADEVLVERARGRST